MSETPHLTKRQREKLTEMRDDILQLGFTPFGSGEWRLANRLHDLGLIRINHSRAPWVRMNFTLTDAALSSLKGDAG